MRLSISTKIFFGFVAVAGTAFVNLGFVPELALWAAVPVGALATNILVVNNIRDRRTDREAGKSTLVARFGRRFGEIEFFLLLALAYLVPLLLWRTGTASLYVLFPWITLPRAALLFGQLLRLDGKELNQTLVGAARLMVLHGLLFVVGLVIGAPLVAGFRG